MATGDIEKLRSALSLKPDTGVLVWRISSGSARAGKAASSVASTGYGRVKVDGVTYPSHRVVWALYHGEFPDGPIDHINGNRSDNRVSNLRRASNSQNQMNRGSATGRKGVTWSAARGKWLARCAANGRRHHVGYFDDVESALAAYRAKAVELHGEFFRG